MVHLATYAQKCYQRIRVQTPKLKKKKKCLNFLNQDNYAGFTNSVKIVEFVVDITVDFIHYVAVKIIYGKNHSSFATDRT